MYPTLDVDVADPLILRPESVVVPNPVAETERNEVLVLPATLVEEAIENSVAFVLPYRFSMPRFDVGVDVPIPRFPADVSRAHSVRPDADPFVKNARSAAGDVVDTLVSTVAIRAVDVAVVVARTQFVSEHNSVSLNNSPVPIPAADVEVAKCVSESTSLTAPTFVSTAVAESAVLEANENALEVVAKLCVRKLPPPFTSSDC